MASQLKNKARPARVEQGILDIWLPETGLKTPDELAKELAVTLEQIYNTPWQVTASNKQVKTETFIETEQRQKADAITAATQHKSVKRVLDSFPDAKVVAVETKTN